VRISRFTSAISKLTLKLDDMPKLKQEKLQSETNNCKKLLCFIMDENIQLKETVSGILKNGFDESLLEEVEIFHNRFIKEDELIGLLRNDMAELDKLLLKQDFSNGKIIKEADKKVKKLCKNIKKTEEHLTTVKFEFNRFLLEYIY
jgi:hypothetical protein